jgi:EpsI family protein
LDTPAPGRGWSIEATPATNWRPRYEGASTSVFQTYRKGDRVVVLYLGYYPQQRQGAGLVTSTNIMVVQKHPVWSNVGESHRQEDLGKGPLDVRQTLLRSAPQRLLIWDFFHISGRELTNPYLAKLLLAKNKLFDRGNSGAAIIVATPYDIEPGAAAATLRDFLRDMGPSIDATLARIENRAGALAH